MIKIDNVNWLGCHRSQRRKITVSPLTSKSSVEELPPPRVSSMSGPRDELEAAFSTRAGYRSSSTPKLLLSPIKSLVSRTPKTLAGIGNTRGYGSGDPATRIFDRSYRFDEALSRIETRSLYRWRRIAITRIVAELPWATRHLDISYPRMFLIVRCTLSLRMARLIRAYN